MFHNRFQYELMKKAQKRVRKSVVYDKRAEDEKHATIT